MCATGHRTDDRTPRRIPGLAGSAQPDPIAIPKPSWLIRALHRRRGIRAINDELLRRSTGIDVLLAAGGATFFGRGTFHGPLIMQNTDQGYRLLRIGANVHLGAGCLLDVAGRLDIEPDATISMGCTILTHTSVGDRPLKDRIPSRVLETRIGHGAYLGANVTVLAGCDIGSEAIVGAGSVVIRPVEAGTTVAGVPARPI